MEKFWLELHKIDGHNHKQIENIFNKKRNGKPTAIIANTIKGKGISLWKMIIIGIAEYLTKKK